MILDPDGVERDWKAGYLPPAEDFMAWLQSAVDGRLTVRDLRRRIQAEPKNPEVRILLGRKHQERHQRDEALALFREAAALDPKGVLMTRTGDGAVVSCRELAEFETARTYTVTWGTMERDWMPKFIKSHPASPLLREAYLEAGRFTDLADSREQSFYGEIMDRIPHDPVILTRLGDELNRLGEKQASNPILDSAAVYAEKTEEWLRKSSPAAAAKTLADLSLAKGDWARAEGAYGADFIADQTGVWARTLVDYAEFWRTRKKNETDALAAIRLALTLRPDDAGIRQSAARGLLWDPPRLEEALAVYGPAWLAASDRSAPELYDYLNFWMTREANRESALAAADALLAKAPESLHFRRSAASILWKADETVRAQAAFGPDFAASHPDRLAYLYEYGMFWIPRGVNAETAVPALVKAASQPFMLWTNRWQAAQMLVKSGHAAEAEQVFGPSCLESLAEEEMALSPYVQFWLERKTNPQTVLRALELMASRPRFEWSDRYQAASAYLQLGRAEKAEAVYGTAYLTTILTDARKLVYYAQFWWYKRQNLFSAMEAARTAVKIAPTQADAWATLADLLQLDGKIDEARQAIGKAVGLAGSTEERGRYEKRRIDIAGAAEKK